MQTIKAVELRDNFSNICNIVAGGETVIVSRPRSQNVVILSEKEYNEILKAKQNADYMTMIDRSIQELEEGRTVVKTTGELEALANG